MDNPGLAAPSTCADCGAQIAPGLLACPGCRALVHAARLKELAAEAKSAEAAGELAAALSHWRATAELLPGGSRQRELVGQEISRLSGLVTEGAPSRGAMGSPATPAAAAKDPTSGGRRGAWTGGLAAAGLLIWKLKAVVAFILSKGKLLLAGLGKGGTLLSMLASLGAYWAAFGWKFAAGLIVSIYIHEMGHVAQLRRYGVAASAPMFIPGIGAVIRLRQHFMDPREDARVGLAGPVWGTLAAVGTWGVYLLTHWPSWAAIAHVAAWINLFNLLPVWSLDGGRAFNALTRGQRALMALVIGGMLLATHEGLLMLILIAAILRAVSPAAPKRPDWYAATVFALLIALLSTMGVVMGPLAE